MLNPGSSTDRRREPTVIFLRLEIDGRDIRPELLSYRREWTDPMRVAVGHADAAANPEETRYVAGYHHAAKGIRLRARAPGLTSPSAARRAPSSMIRDGQLASALDVVGSTESPVALVTLEIGGNDLLRLLGNEP